MTLLHVLRIVTGTDSGASIGYLWWSGFFADLTIFAAGIVFIRRANCHTKGCLRLGHHPVEGTPYKVCRAHHPDVPSKGASADHIHDAHRHARGQT